MMNARHAQASLNSQSFHVLPHGSIRGGWIHLWIPFKIERTDIWIHVSDRGVILPIGTLRFLSFYQGFIMVSM